jgi:hypothetical protein
LTSVTIGNSVTSIGDDAFYGCNGLTSPVYNAHVFAFMPTSYSGAYTIPDGIESIAGFAFEGCNSLTSVTIPNSVTSIGSCAFYNCSGLTSVIIPNSVTSIGDYAFTGCTGLTSIEIPNSVTSIGDRAFRECTGLTSVTCYALVPPSLDRSVWPGNLSAIYVPAQSLETYKNAQGWINYSDFIFPIGATQTQTDNVHVETSETTVTIVWPSINGAASYELVIKDKSGNIICTLVFNTQGQLISIVFHAPGRDIPQQTQTAGFSFTVTGLEEGKSYDLTITAKDGNGAILDQKTVSFITGDEQGIEDIDAKAKAHKLLRNGQILILRGDRTYTVTGQELR